MKKQLFTFLLIACTLFFHLDAALEVKLSKSIVGLNESFNLGFTSKHPSHAQPDFTPLQADFEVLSCGQSSSIKIINNLANRENHWHLVLQPKSEGELIIPAITCGNERSSPKTIQVTAPRIIQQDESLILETEVFPNDDVYEQAQVIYTIKLYCAVQIAQASLTELKVNDSDAIIERLGKDTQYELMHPNGTRYTVIEQKYAIFPQRPGELIFDPITFDGKIVKSATSFFNMQTEHKRLTTKSLQIYVKPIPASFQKNEWFPANSVKLKEEWSADPSTMTAGEPLTRTIIVTAEGCTGNQIPTLAFNFPAEIKHYLDKPETVDKATAQGFVGKKQMKVALIAPKAGDIVLPEVKLKWWDVKSNQERTAFLPSRTIHVQESAIAMNTDPVAANAQSALPQDLESMATRPAEELSLPAWAWGLIALNAIWVFILLKAILRKAQKMLPSKPLNPCRLKSKGELKNELKRACQLNDAKQAEIHLLSWLNHLFPQVISQNLAGFRPYLSSALQGAVDELNAALYGYKAHWQGEGLWLAASNFKPELKAAFQANHHPEHLKELY